VKRLIVIRHAKSSWDNPLLGDFDRPLNERGERDAPRMGKRLKEKRIVPDLLLSSPAKRALKTCEIIGSILNYPTGNIKADRELYHADEYGILHIIKNINDKHDTVLIFGHNPGLTDFVNRLTDSVIDNVPTCGVVSCSLNVPSWRDIEWGNGKVDFFDFPKKKD
jgi:phosphohistidine phosphatase